MRTLTLLAALAAVATGLPAAAATPAASPAPEKLLLWPGAQAGNGDEIFRTTDQGEHVYTYVRNPSLTAYLPAKPNGVAVIVVPGGGHRELWMDHEGHNVARFLNEHGIAAFVLMYRLARAPGSTWTIEGDELNDLKQAIRLVRSGAGKWSLDPQKIGVIGFSAGGQLAALGATKSDAGNPKSAVLVENFSSRPDFAALIYPGAWPQYDINANTPPMFLLCGGDDKPDVVAGVVGIYSALRAAKVPAELHLYDGVGHGFGLRSSNQGPIAAWPQQFVDWLRVRGLITQ